MTLKVELITDPDCPNVEATREQLRQAFAAVGEVPSWDEWDRQADDAPDLFVVTASKTDDSASDQ